MESMGVASECGCKEVLIILIPTPLVSVLFCSSIPTFCSYKIRIASWPPVQCVRGSMQVGFQPFYIYILGNIY